MQMPRYHILRLLDVCPPAINTEMQSIAVQEIKIVPTVVDHRDIQNHSRRCALMLIPMRTMMRRVRLPLRVGLSGVMKLSSVQVILS